MLGALCILFKMNSPAENHARSSGLVGGVQCTFCEDQLLLKQITLDVHSAETYDKQRRIGHTVNNASEKWVRRIAKRTA